MKCIDARLWQAVLVLAVGLVACTPAQPERVTNTVKASPPQNDPIPTMTTYQPLSPAERKTKLTPMQYKVTQENGTEPPFQNAYWNNNRPGLYVDIVSGEPLFTSLEKFDSGCGWPSFTQPVAGAAIVEKPDLSLGQTRTEVRSKMAGSHLGHVFADGPQPTGLRYCINSAALKFIPLENLAAAGYGAYLEPFVKAGLIKPQAQAAAVAATAQPAAPRETATLAGGCFWGMQEILRKIPGVIQTTVGYAGGKVSHPTYAQVCTGKTGHAESVQIIFDPTKLSYEQVLGFFFRMHDPTTLDRQHNDVGVQYRSAIFYHSEAQRQTAVRVKAAVNKSGKWKAPVVTEITAATEFYPAEPEHQDYLQKNPGGYTCHFLRD